MKHVLNRLINHETISAEEAKQNLINISKDVYNQSQIAAFLTVFMMRTVTLEELKGFRDALLELCIPVLAVMGLVKLFNVNEKKDQKLKALKYTSIITGGLALVFLLFKTSLFDFVGVNDGFYRQNYGQAFIDAIKEDRKTIFNQDTIRTLVLVLLSAGTIYMYLKDKLKEKWTIVVFGMLILFDLVGVDRRYVNNDDFVSSIQVNKPFVANEADNYILQDTSYYRVFDLVGGAAKPSYFHNSLNGYNAAELKRYSELFDFYVAQNNLKILNMLNAKYLIAQDSLGTVFPYTNDEANGNAWFVKELKKVNSANEEMLALGNLDNKIKAVLNSERNHVIDKYSLDSLASIKLIKHKPNQLKYLSKNRYEGFAVFSEIYYPNGWKTFLDGKEAKHIRVNYVLRGMQIPAGDHIIEFKFDPDVVKTGSAISLASSILVGILVILGLLYQLKQKKNHSA